MQPSVIDTSSLGDKVITVMGNESPPGTPKLLRACIAGVAGLSLLLGIYRRAGGRREAASEDAPPLADPG